MSILASTAFSHKALSLAASAATLLAMPYPVAATAQAARRATPPARPASAPPPVARPTQNYWVYVGAESADKMHRIRFGPAGAAVEKTIPVGEQAAEMEGPHGLIISPDARFLYLTTGHGTPAGKLWKYELGPDTLVAPGLPLGNFPASIDITPDGLYTMSSNFNLHGDMIPSTISVVYTPTMTEMSRPVTCTMPHGSRITPDGLAHYSGCMMDDQLVEIDARSFEVSRRFSLAKGKEGALAKTAGAMTAGEEHAGHDMAASGARPAARPPVDPAEAGAAAMGGMKHDMVPNSCSPTWAQPSFDGKSVFVACNKSDEIVEVDRTKWAISRRFKTGRGPYNLTVTPDGKLLLVTLKQGAMFEIFDLASGQSVMQAKNSTTVSHGVAVSSDSRYAFVSSEGVGAAPGKVDIYDLKARAKVATVDVAQQAGGIAFWKQEPAAK